MPPDVCAHHVVSVFAGHKQKALALPRAVYGRLAIERYFKPAAVLVFVLVEELVEVILSRARRQPYAQPAGAAGHMEGVNIAGRSEIAQFDHAGLGDHAQIAGIIRMVCHGQQVFRRFISGMAAEKAQRVHLAPAFHAHEEPRGVFGFFQHIFFFCPEVRMSAPDVNCFSFFRLLLVTHHGQITFVAVLFTVCVYGDHRRAFQPGFAMGNDLKASGICVYNHCILIPSIFSYPLLVFQSIEWKQ